MTSSLHCLRLDPCSLILIIGLGAGFSSGCSSLDVDKKQPMETSLVPFGQGEVAATIKASLKTTWKTAQNAAKELGMSIEQLDYSPPGAFLTVHTPTGKRMDIRFKKNGFLSTSVSILMGAKGDELLQRQFLAKLENSL